jgi:3-deoxy-D-manno-octulosonate 8-phosphate phosphatase KdsC-like HAD superfamily phosphatase
MVFDKLFLVDVDGVLTNGRKVYGGDGMPAYKEFYDKDFTALKELTAAGYRIVFVSGDDFINKQIAKNRGYEFVSARGKNKGELAEALINSSMNTFIKVLAVGDDIFDLEMLPYVDSFYLPSNAHWRLLELAQGSEKMSVLDARGGEGIILEIGKKELKETKLEEITGKILELDAAEVF